MSTALPLIGWMHFIALQIAALTKLYSLITHPKRVWSKEGNTDEFEHDAERGDDRQ